MTLKRLLFPLAEDRPVLRDRWWHRLCVVLCVVCLIGGFTLSLFLASIFIRDSPFFGITLSDNLHSFSRQSDPSIANTIPLFLRMGGKLGCLKDTSTLVPLATETLVKTSYCSADLKRHPEEQEKALKEALKEAGVERERDPLAGFVTEETYCAIGIKVGCFAEDIVMYRVDILFYVHMLLYAVLATYLFSLILQLVYFKGLIYIIYGRYRRPNPPPS